MKLESIEKSILEEIIKHEFITAKQLALSCSVNEKTVRQHIRYLSSILEENGANIRSYHAKGYRLEITDQDEFDSFYNGGLYDFSKIPISSEERPRYILDYLLFKNLMSDSYVELLEFCEILNVSESGANVAIREARKIAEEYDLLIEQKRNKGYRITGNEFAMRICFGNEKFSSKAIDSAMMETIRKNDAVLKRIIRKAYKDNHLYTTDTAVDFLSVYLHVSLARIKRGHPVGSVDQEFGFLLKIDQTRSRIAEQIAEEAGNYLKISMDQDEIDHLHLYIISQRVAHSFKNNGDRFTVYQTYVETAKEILDYFYDYLGIDYRNDDKLLNDIVYGLDIHLLPMIIRARYNIGTGDVLYQQIRQKCPTGHFLAQETVAALRNKYMINGNANDVFTNESLGYLSLLFEPFIRKRIDKNDTFRKSILLVVPDDLIYTDLLEYRFVRDFKDKIRTIKTISSQELAAYDISETDVIFSAAPLKIQLSKPAFELQYFYDDEDSKEIREILESVNEDKIDGLIERRLFFSDLEAKDKDEVLKILFEEAKKYYPISEEYFEGVLKREKDGPTDIGKYVALAHYALHENEKPFIAFAVLHKPLDWGNREVSMVCLCGINRHNKKIEKIYSDLCSVLLDHDKVRSLLKEPKYDNLIRLLND